MSESDIDMDRCLLGIDDEKAWVPKIIWHNCVERMPPDDSTKVISVVGDSKPYTVSGSLVRAEYLRWKNVSPVPVTWTEFTKEKWEALNNGN